MKKYIVSLNRLDREALSNLTRSFGGIYRLDLRNVSVERLQRASLAFTDEALSRLVGRVILCSSFTNEDGNDMRLKPIGKYLPRSIASLLGGGTFNYRACANFGGVAGVNTSVLGASFFCTKCGRLMGQATAEAHDCTRPPRPRCAICGEELHSRREKARGICIECAKHKASTIYSYHDRPYRYDPLFTHPKQRASVLHIGTELEIAGNGGRMDRTDFAGKASGVLNVDPFRPFVEFEGDSSTEGGVECIFAPATAEDFFNKSASIGSLYETAKECGGEFKVANGLHFHLDKRYFGDSGAVLKAQLALETLVYKYFPFFQRISGRQAGCFNYSRKKDGVHDFLTATLNHSRRDRYDAINCTPSYTIELRFFGGHIDSADDFLACVDIVQALGAWAKKTSLRSIIGAKPSDIIKYLKRPQLVADYIERNEAKAQALGYALAGETTEDTALRLAFVSECRRRG